MYKGREEEFAVGEQTPPASPEKDTTERSPLSAAAFISGIQTHIDAVAKARQHYSLEKLRRAPQGSGFAEMGTAEEALMLAVHELGEKATDDSVYAVARELQGRYELFAQNSDNLDDRSLDSQKEEALNAAAKLLLSVVRERRGRV